MVQIKSIFEDLLNTSNLFKKLRGDKTHNTCVNLLNPTLGTTIQTGVTCEALGDGIYRLNGDNGSNTSPWFVLRIMSLKKGKYKLTGIKEYSSVRIDLGIWKNNTNVIVRISSVEKSNGIFELTEDVDNLFIDVGVVTSGAINNYVIKPMITTDLDATYDDFVPYTGDSGRLNENVSNLSNAQTDLKMLGWSVPEEMPIKNYVDSYRVFHQRVGRVDLGSIGFWRGDAGSYGYWYSDPIKHIKTPVDNYTPSNIFLTKYSLAIIKGGHQIYGNQLEAAINTSDQLLICNESSTAKPTGYLYYELANEILISMDGNEAVNQLTNSNASKNCVCDALVGYNLVSNGTFSNDSSGAAFSMQIAAVESGKTYTIKTDESSLVAGFFSSKPTANSTTYNGQRIISGDKTFAVPSGIKYVAFRTTKDYAFPQCELGMVSTAYVPYNGDSNKHLSDEIDILNSNSYFLQKMSASKGAFLGTEFTAQQKRDIANSDFSLLPLGGYWTIGGHNWRIWDANWFINKGDTACTEPHLVIMPDDNLLKADGSTHYMNDTNTTDGGYAGTKYRSTYRQQCEDIVKSCFGNDAILSHRELLCNAVTNGKPSRWNWYDATVELPGEIMLIGSTVWSNYTDGGSGYNVGTAYPQLALARICPEKVIIRENYWERDVATDNQFAFVYGDGGAVSGDASGPWEGVRPYFLLKGSK